MPPDIILINSHGLKSHEAFKIPGYKIHKINTSNSQGDGSGIAIKSDIPHKLQDDSDTDFLAVEVNTSLGPIILATTYLPPRRPYLPFTDYSITTSLHMLLAILMVDINILVITIMIQ